MKKRKKKTISNPNLKLTDDSKWGKKGGKKNRWKTRRHVDPERSLPLEFF